MKRPSLARWHVHINATAPARDMSRWLTLPTSLTAALRDHCRSFHVQLLNQQTTRCLADESDAIALPRRLQVRQREVLLCCDGVPVVFAHTVVPLTATAADWPMFRALGENSLGASLFGDPLVIRDTLQFSRLPVSHPLMQRIRSALPAEGIESRLHARRCLFRRKRGLMMVTEVFLPGILTLNNQ